MSETVLVADEDIGASQALADFLEANGFMTLQAGREADILERFQSNEVRLVVIDTNVGESCGWATWARLAALNPLIPAIVTTAEYGQKARAAEAGVDALLEKPVEFEVLLRIARELLAQSTEMRLQRVCSVEAFSRYVPRSYETFLRKLQERYTEPLAMPELDRVLKRCAPAGDVTFPVSGAQLETGIGMASSKGFSGAPPE